MDTNVARWLRERDQFEAKIEQLTLECHTKAVEIERLQKERDAARLLNRNAIGVARQLYRMFLADMSEYTQETLPTEHPWLKEDD